MYGDTDGVFVQCSSKYGIEITLEDAELVGNKISGIVADSLPDPMELEFESIAKRALFVAKKRYAIWVFERDGDGWGGRIKARTGMSPPIGERIPFVIIADRGLFVDRAEDPDYVRGNNIPLDVDYYVKKQILPPVERILGVFGMDMASLDYDSKQKGLFNFTGAPSDGKVVRNAVKNEEKEKGRGLKKDRPQSSLFDF